jgi:hypothetical protein
MSDEDVRIICPECGGKYYLKPPYNSIHRCMRCRYKWGMKSENDRGTGPTPLPALNSKGQRVLTFDERIAFEKAWDAKVMANARHMGEHDA